jgi:hypothetical protein
MRRLRRSAVIFAILVAGCSTLRQVPVAEPVIAQVIFFKNGQVLGTVGAEPQQCERVRAASLERRPPDFAHTFGITENDARSALDRATSSCTTASVVSTTTSAANMWLVVIADRGTIGPHVLFGATTEDACQEMLRDDRARAAQIHCRPMRVDRLGGAPVPVGSQLSD